MQPRNMDWVVAGKRYCTEESTLLAHDAYWNNNYNWEHEGRNTFLFRTPNGYFFSQHQSLVPGQLDSIRPLTIDEAMHLYHLLGRKEVPFPIAFPYVKVRSA